MFLLIHLGFSISKVSNFPLCFRVTSFADSAISLLNSSFVFSSGSNSFGKVIPLPKSTKSLFVVFIFSDSDTCGVACVTLLNCSSYFLGRTLNKALFGFVIWSCTKSFTSPIPF